MPAALAGCALRPDNRLPPGEIVGTSASLGHRLRDGLRLPFPGADQLERKQVVIVGGGIAGLARAGSCCTPASTISWCSNWKTSCGGTARSGE